MKHVPDIFAIGTQESFSERTEWDITIQEVLGPSHLLLHSSYLGMYVCSCLKNILTKLHDKLPYTLFQSFVNELTDF